MPTILRAATGAFGCRALGSWAAPIRETKLNERWSKPWPSLSRGTTMPHWRKPKSGIGTSKSQPAKDATVAVRAHFEPPLDEGNGWVNWSGLAAVLADVAHAISAPLHRLLG